jgi:hypothetical protein
MLVCAVSTEAIQWGTVPLGAPPTASITPLSADPREEQVAFSPFAFALSVPLVFSVTADAKNKSWRDELFAQAEEQASLTSSDGACVYCPPSGMLLRLSAVLQDVTCEELATGARAAAPGGSSGGHKSKGGGGGGGGGGSGGGGGVDPSAASASFSSPVPLEILMEQPTSASDRPPPKLAVVPSSAGARLVTCRLVAMVIARPLANECAATLLRGMTGTACVGTPYPTPTLLTWTRCDVVGACVCVCVRARVCVCVCV